MDTHIRDSWITAGKTIQTFTKISNAKMQEVPRHNQGEGNWFGIFCLYPSTLIISLQFYFCDCLIRCIDFHSLIEHYSSKKLT